MRSYRTTIHQTPFQFFQHLNLYTWLKHIFIANPKDLLGPGYSDKQTRQLANLVALAITSGSLLDLLSNQTLMQALTGLPPLFAFPIGLGMNIFLLVCTNTSATLAGHNVTQKRGLAIVGTIIFIGLSITRSIIAPASVELYLNASNINIQAAQEQVETLRQDLNRLRTDPELDDIRQQATQAAQALDQTPRTDPEWDRRYLKVHGRYSQTYTCTTPDKASLPLAFRQACLEEAAGERYREASLTFERQLNQVGNPLLFLRKHRPEFYSLYFTPEGDLRSGYTAARIAIQNLGNRVKNGAFQDLGLPLVAFLFSAFTSALACGASIAFGLTPGAQRSHDKRLAWAQDEFLKHWAVDQSLDRSP